MSVESLRKKYIDGDRSDEKAQGVRNLRAKYFQETGDTAIRSAIKNEDALREQYNAYKGLTWQHESPAEPQYSRSILGIQLPDKTTQEPTEHYARTAEEYASIVNANDYAWNSMYKSTLVNGSDQYKGKSAVYTDPHYEHVNQMIPNDEEDYESFLSNDEKGIYNYLYAKEGEASANTYLASLREDLLDRQGRSKYADELSALEVKRQNADFADLSKYVSTGKDYDGRTIYGNGRYETVNKNPEFVYGNLASDSESGLNKGIDTAYYDLLNASLNSPQMNAETRYRYLEPEEIQMYNYLYSTEGEESANHYLEMIDYDLQKRARQAFESEQASHAQENPLTTSVASIMQSPYKALSNVANVGNLLMNGETDQNAWYNSASFNSSAVMQGVHDAIDSDDSIFKSGVSKTIAKFGYDTAMSIGNSFYNRLITGAMPGISKSNVEVAKNLSLLLMSSQAAADSLVEGKDRGLTEGQAVGLSIVAGIAEYYTEQHSIESFLNMDNLSSGKLVYWLKNILSEGSEEVASDLINMVADVVVMSDKSQLRESIDNYKAQGYSDGEAVGLTALDQAKQLGVSFAAGALSGGVMAGGAVLGNNIGLAVTGHEINKSPVDVGLLINEGQYNDKSSSAYKLSNKMLNRLNNGKMPTSLQTGTLAQYQAFEKMKGEQGDEDLKSAVAHVNESNDLRFATLSEEEVQAIKENSAAIAELKTVSPDMKTNTEGIIQAVREYARVSNELEHSADKSAVNKMIQSNAENIEDTTHGFTHSGFNSVRNYRYQNTQSAEVSVENANRIANTLTEEQSELSNLIRVAYADIAKYSSVLANTPGEEFAKAMIQAYDLGTQGKSAIDIVRKFPQIASSYITQAHSLGSRMAEGGTNGRANGNINITQRSDSNASNVSGKGMAEEGQRQNAGTGRQGTQTIHGNSRSLVKVVTNKEIFGGKANGKEVRLVKPSKEIEEFVQNAAKERGFKGEIFYTDNVMTANDGKGDFAVDGWISPDDKRIYVSVNTPGKSAEKIALHELTHYTVTSDKRKVHAFEDYIRSRDEELADMIEDAYMDLYQCEGNPGKAWEEAYCDSVAGINAFENAIKNQAVGKAINEKQGLLKNAVSKADEIRGSPEEHTPTTSYQDALRALQGGYQYEGDDDPFGKHSRSSIADSVGIVATKEGDYYYRGELLNKLKGAKLRTKIDAIVTQSRLFKLVKLAEASKFISADDADAQKKYITELVEMLIKQRDTAMTYAFSGSMLWSGIKENADKQYKKTIDFEAVCKKTEQMVAVMSEAMVRKGRGLTLEEITHLYNEVVESEETVPCPACYVFSRWIGLGGLLDNIKSYQVMYANSSIEDLNRVLNKVGRRVDAYKRSNESFGKARSRLVNDLAKKEEKVTQQYNVLLASGASKEELNAKLKEQQEIANDLTEVRSYEWIEKVRKKKNYQPVPDEILFDLQAGEEFASNPKYKDAWAFRTSQGAGYGKAITPYADARLGEIIQGIHKGVKSIKMGAKNPFAEIGDTLTSDQKKEMNAGIKAVRQQNLRGGVRMQSVSDFRYEFALDYIQTFFELQAIGAGIQTYTKVVEFVPIVASVGGFVNMSLMPAGNGVKNGKLVYSSTIGIDYKTAVKLQNEYATAGTILMSVSDEHTILAMKDDTIYFIIPYHRSGGRADVIEAMLASLGETQGNYDSYEDVQSEKFPSTENENPLLKLRNKILKGNTKLTLTEAEKRLLATNQYLSSIYERKYNTPGDPLYHTQMTATDTKQIFPYEYWDTTSTFKTADINGQRYLEYCEALGVTPKFSGNKKGTHDFRKYPGYWKLLIDRRMYGLNGEYLPLTNINASGLDNSLLDQKKAKKRFGDAMSKRADRSKTSAIVDRAFPETVKQQNTGRASRSVVQENETVKQEISSANTSIKQIPALFTDSRVRFGKTNIDIGGGKYDLATEYLKEQGTTNMVFDPYNRDESTNQKVVDYLRSGKKADTATCANVLNVIAEKDARENVILEVAKSIKPDGTAYFMVYEGDGSGNGRETKAGYQNNLKTAEYVSEISEYFDDVRRQGKLITAKKPKKGLPVAVWEISPGNGQRFSRSLNDRYMELAKDPVDNVDELKQMVEAEAKKNGYVLSAYHGTGEYFNTFRLGREGIHLGNYRQASQVAESRYEERSRNTWYRWSKIKDNIDKLDNSSLYELLDEFEKISASYDVEPYEGDPTNREEIVKYGDRIAEISESNPSYHIRTFDRETGENILRLYAKIDNPFIINGDIAEWTPNNIASVLLERANGITTRVRMFSNSEYSIDGSPFTLNSMETKLLQKIADYEITNDTAWDTLANVLKWLGYDGIKYLNQYEGDRNSYSYIALHPSDVKSADVVTYDDQGNIIPLSQRFNNDNDDIRYSRSVDDRYMELAKDPEKNEEQIRAIVRDYAYKAGYTKEGYHGTLNFGFTQIDLSNSDDGISFFVTDDLKTAETYSTTPNVRNLSDSDGTIEEIEKRLENKLEDIHDNTATLTEEFNQAAGVYNYIDYVNTDDAIQDILEEGSEHPEDQVIEMVDEMLWALYEDYFKDDPDYEDYDEWRDLSDAAIDINEATDELVNTISEYVEISKGRTEGNYHLFFNPTGLMTVDGNGHNWNRIEFNPDNSNEDSGVVWNTRTISRYAKDHGYSGVWFKDIYDNGGRSHKRLENPADVYVLFNPQEQAKSADLVTYDDNGNIIPLSERFKSDNNDIRYSRSTAPEFYSKLERELEKFKGEKIGASSVVSFLKGKGVKDEEIKWSGVETFLEGKKSVSKAELLQYVKDNQIQIEEKVLDSEYDSNDYDSYHNAEQFTWSVARDMLEEQGEEHYNIEVDYDADTGFTAYNRRHDGVYEEVFTYNPEENRTHWADYKTPGGENYREILYKIPGSDYSNQSMIIHWGEKGVLAHARVQDFETDDGKILFVDEIQSDWHNEGQKYGYGQNDPETLRKIEKLQNEFSDLQKEYDGLKAPVTYREWQEAESLSREYTNGEYTDILQEFQKYYDENGLANILPNKWNIDADLKERMQLVSNENKRLKDDATKKRNAFKEYSKTKDDLAEKLSDLSKRLNKLNKDNDSRVPDVPFRNGTYIQYVLKDLLRKAAEGGYDYLAWTTGKMQEDRWSSNYAEGYRIEYDQDIPKFLSKYSKQWGAKPTQISVASEYAQEINELYNILVTYDQDIYVDDFVESIGSFDMESIADNFDFSDEDYARVEELADLINGAFYDGQLTEEQIRTYASNPDFGIVPAIPITDAMKESVLYEGQARFSRSALPENADDTAKEVVDRLYRRASLIDKGYLYGTPSAMYKDERIENEIELSYATGLSNKDYAQAYIVFMHPGDFIRATSTPSWRGELYQEVENRAKALESDSWLDKESLTNQRQSMYLMTSVDEDGDTIITGHEGRHRMIGLEKEGYNYVPVIILPSEHGYPKGQDRYHTKPIPVLALRGEYFGGNGNGETIFAHDILPLSANYADIARDVFAGGKNTLRFSRSVEENRTLKDADTDLRTRVRDLQKELKVQTERAEHFKSETHLRLEKPGADQYQITEKALNAMVKQLQERETSSADIKEDLRKLVNDFLNGRTSYDEAFNMACYIGNHLIAESRDIINQDAVDELNRLKQFLRVDKISINDSEKSSIPDYNSFRKRNLSRIRLTNDGTPMDTYWQDTLQPSFGKAMFPDEITSQADQLLHLDELLRTLEPIFANPYTSQSDIEYGVEAVAMSIIDTLTRSDEIEKVAPTFADKQKRRRESEVNEVRTVYKQKLKDLREDRDTHWKEFIRDSKEKARDRKFDRETRQKLLRIARRLQNKKLPRAERQLLDEYLKDLDTISVRMTKVSIQNLTALKEWYEEQKKNPDFIPDEATEERLLRLTQRHIGDMTQEEVMYLTMVLQNIEHEIAFAKHLYAVEDRRTVYQMAETSVKNITNSVGTKLGIQRTLDSMFVMGALSGERMARRLTGYVDDDPFYLAMKALSDGQRVMLDYQMKSSHPFDKYTNNKSFVESISGKKARRIHVTGQGIGGTASADITPSEMISLYLHSKNAQNMRHIDEGGVTIPDFDLLVKGKIQQAYDKATTIRFKPSAIAEFSKQLTAEEMAFATEIEKYYAKSQDAINEVSEKLKGYALAQVENYFPIETDPDFLKRDIEQMHDNGTIEGMGFLKERVRATNPIMLKQAHTVLNQSITQTSKYIGLAIPVANVNKMMKVGLSTWTEDEQQKHQGTINHALRAKWGSQGVDFVQQLMVDIQNPAKSTSKNEELEKFLNKITGHYAGAVLEMSASVAIKQAASYPTAMAVLGAEPLIKAMGSIGKVDLSLIEKYTPLQWKRSQGFSTFELGEMASGNVKNVPTYLKWIQGVDVATTRKLWKASEIYVRDNMKELVPESDAFYKEVAVIYNRVIEETQPNYTVMQRPGLLRSKGALTRALNMFKTQPYQNFGILYDAVNNYKAKARWARDSQLPEAIKARDKAKKDLINSIVSQLLASLVFSLMQMLWNVVSDKTAKYKNDEGQANFFTVTKGLGLNILANGFGMIPYGSLGLELVESTTDKVLKSFGKDAFFDQTWYGAEVPVVETLNGLAEGLGTALSTITGMINDYATGDDVDEWETVRKIYKSVDEGFQAIGIPAQNIVNLGNAIAGQTQKLFHMDNGYLGYYYSLRIQGASNNVMYQNLYQAYKKDKALYQEVYDAMISDGYTKAAISKFFKKMENK